MGRRMFSGGAGPWDDDPNPDGWWGDDPPFHVPVFVLTHHPRETLEKQGGTSFAFVTDGLDGAVKRARAAAGDRNVSVAGGASVVRQALAAGLLDELQAARRADPPGWRHVAPRGRRPSPARGDARDRGAARDPHPLPRRLEV